MLMKRFLRAVLRASLIVVSSAALLWGGASYADQRGHQPLIVGPTADFITYAAFAKLESNVAEATLNLFLLSKATAKERKSILADFNDDAQAVKVYVGQLGKMNLTSDAASGLTKFKKDWNVFEKQARAAIMKGDKMTLRELHDLYVVANRMDDTVDSVLEKLRSKMAAGAS